MKKILYALLCFLCVGCSTKEAENGRKILVSIPPYATIVKALVENGASVEIVVPPGTNPHIYEPTPDQIKSFTKAKVWFRIGDPVEEKMVQFLKSYPVQIVDLSKNRADLTGSAHHHGGHSHGETDLHLWLDPLIMADQAEEMATVLTELFPEMGDTLNENRKKLVKLLRDADEKIETQLSPLKGQSLLVSHPALGYFCKRYELRQLCVEIEGKDPLPKDIAKLMHLLIKHPVPVVFTEPQYNNKGAVLIAEKLNLPIEEIDPYNENYFEFLKTLSQQIDNHYGHLD